TRSLCSARPSLDHGRRGGDAPVGHRQPSPQAGLLRLRPGGLRLVGGEDRRGIRPGRRGMARQIGETTMFLRGHMQNAYVTHDLDKAMEIIGNQYGMEPFQRIDPVLTIKTPQGNQPMSNRVASYWAGGLNIEVIE